MSGIITLRQCFARLMSKPVQQRVPALMFSPEACTSSSSTGFHFQHLMCPTMLSCNRDMPCSSGLGVRTMHTHAFCVSVMGKVVQKVTRSHRKDEKDPPCTRLSLSIFKSCCKFHTRALHAQLCLPAHYSTSTTEQSPDFTSLSRIVLDATKRADVRAGSVPLRSIENLMQSLYNLGFNTDQITQLLSQRLWLLCEPEAVVKLSELLLSYGVRPQFVICILENLPAQFEYGELSLHKIPSLLNDCLEHLRSLGLSDKKLLSLLIEEPNIIYTDSKTRAGVFRKLKGLFTNADALYILQTCPNVLSDSWSETQAKFDYAFFTMCYDQSQIIKAGLFKHSLEHIENRHMFLVRAGFFTPVKKKDDPRLNPNPPLSDVVSPSNDFFTKTFGGFSVTEYRVYQDMREIEKEAEEEDNALSEDSDEMSSSDEEEEEQLERKKQRKNKKHKR